MFAAGDVVHILRVIAPSRRFIVTPDMGLEGVIEDDEETKRKVVGACCTAEVQNEWYPENGLHKNLGIWCKLTLLGRTAPPLTGPFSCDLISSPPQLHLQPNPKSTIAAPTAPTHLIMLSVDKF